MGHFGNLTFEDYGTHIPFLTACVAKTHGAVVELGCGDYSTYTLHVLCHALGRHLSTFDNDAEWLGRYLELRSPTHWVECFEDLAESDKHDCGVLFIDCKPGEIRGDLLRKWRGHADIILVHDSENNGYGYAPTIAEFKYRVDCYRLRPATTALSDTVDLRFLHLPGDMYTSG